MFAFLIIITYYSPIISSTLAKGEKSYLEVAVKSVEHVRIATIVTFSIIVGMWLFYFLIVWNIDKRLNGIHRQLQMYDEILNYLFMIKLRWSKFVTEKEKEILEQLSLPPEIYRKKLSQLICCFEKLGKESSK